MDADALFVSSCVKTECDTCEEQIGRRAGCRFGTAPRGMVRNILSATC